MSNIVKRTTLIVRDMAKSVVWYEKVLGMTRYYDDEVVLSAGGYIVKPRGQVHAMWNAGSTPARMIEVITTAGFENFFRELSALSAESAPDLAEVGELAERYQLPFAEPDWLGDVIERYGLTPPV
jgi:catechol 2,3-dioxygenase-like lactoylglutathione lyase family enzyme